MTNPTPIGQHRSAAGPAVGGIHSHAADGTRRLAGAVALVTLVGAGRAWRWVAVVVLAASVGAACGAAVSSLAGLVPSAGAASAAGASSTVTSIGSPATALNRP